MVDHIRPNDSVAEYYRKLLLEQICSFGENTAEEHKKYIAALSQYMCSGSETYQYNLTYLIAQNEAFCRFLCSARKKYNVMVELLERIYKTDAVQEFLSKEPQQCDKITILLNNFLKGTLNSKNIYLTEDFSVLAAKCYSTDDLFTICYENRRRSGHINMKQDDLENMIQAVLKIPTQERG